MRFALCFMASCCATASAAEPAPRFFNPEQEGRIRAIAREEAKSVLEAQPRAAQPAPAAAPKAAAPACVNGVCAVPGACGDGACPACATCGVANAPAAVGVPSDPRMQWRSLPGIGFGWVEPGVTAATLTPAPAVYATPTFPTPVRSYFAPQTYQLAPAFGSPCANGRCPTAR
jgi:hypothetical protein